MKLLYSTTGGESSYAIQLGALLSEARTSVRLAAHRIDSVFVSMYTDQLRRLAARGVEVQLLLSNAHVDAAADALAGLRRALPLLELRVAANLHAKVFLVDREHLLL